jgi:hypothetical protein
MSMNTLVRQWNFVEFLHFTAVSVACVFVLKEDGTDKLNFDRNICFD